MNKYILIFSFLASFTSFGQISVNGGASMLLGFGAPKPWGGFHLGINIPRDEDITFQVQYQYLFKQKLQEPLIGVATAKDPFASPYNIQVDLTPSMDYHIISGGTRYYFINGYDYGFSLYGGGTFSLIFNSIRSKTTAYDADNYDLDEYSRDFEKAAFLNIAAGVSGGMKYSISNVGSVYLDVGLLYMVFSNDNKNGRVIQKMFEERLYNRVLLTFQVGFRRDISWKNE